MPKPIAVIDYGLCDPEACGCERIPCHAVLACERRVLRQDELGEPPFVQSLCLGCGTCVKACPRKAIRQL